MANDNKWTPEVRDEKLKLVLSQEKSGSEKALALIELLENGYFGTASQIDSEDESDNSESDAGLYIEYPRGLDRVTTPMKSVSPSRSVSRLTDSDLDDRSINNYVRSDTGPRRFSEFIARHADSDADADADADADQDEGPDLDPRGFQTFDQDLVYGDDNSELAGERSDSASSRFDRDPHRANLGYSGAGAVVAAAAASAGATVGMPQHDVPNLPSGSRRFSWESGRRDDISNSDISVHRTIKLVIDPQWGDLIRLPPSEPGTPCPSFDGELPELPESRPGTPPLAMSAPEKSRGIARGRAIIFGKEDQRVVPLQFRSGKKIASPPPVLRLQGGSSTSRNERLRVSEDLSSLSSEYGIEEDIGETSRMYRRRVEGQKREQVILKGRLKKDEKKGLPDLWTPEVTLDHDLTETKTETKKPSSGDEISEKGWARPSKKYKKKKLKTKLHARKKNRRLQSRSRTRGDDDDDEWYDISPAETRSASRVMESLPLPEAMRPPSAHEPSRLQYRSELMEALYSAPPRKRQRLSFLFRRLRNRISDLDLSWGLFGRFRTAHSKGKQQVDAQPRVMGPRKLPARPPPPQVEAKQLQTAEPQLHTLGLFAVADIPLPPPSSAPHNMVMKRVAMSESGPSSAKKLQSGPRPALTAKKTTATSDSETLLRTKIFNPQVTILSTALPEPIWTTPPTPNLGTRNAPLRYLFPKDKTLTPHTLLPQGNFVAERQKDINNALTEIELGVGVTVSGFGVELSSKGLPALFQPYQWINMWRSVSREIHVCNRLISSTTQEQQEHDEAANTLTPTPSTPLLHKLENELMSLSKYNFGQTPYLTVITYSSDVNSGAVALFRASLSRNQNYITSLDLEARFQDVPREICRILRKGVKPNRYELKRVGKNLSCRERGELGAPGPVVVRRGGGGAGDFEECDGDGDSRGGWEWDIGGGWRRAILHVGGSNGAVPSDGDGYSDSDGGYDESEDGGSPPREGLLATVPQMLALLHLRHRLIDHVPSTPIFNFSPPLNGQVRRGIKLLEEPSGVAHLGDAVTIAVLFSRESQWVKEQLLWA